MIKQLLVASFLSFSFCSLAQFPDQNDIEKENLQGKVKSMVTRMYDADEKFGEIVKTAIIVTYEEEFNKQGNHTEFDKKSRQASRSYNEKYKYDNGLLAETKYKAGEGIFVTQRLYNKLGQVQEENEYNSRGTLTGKTKYQWRSFSNKSGYTEYNAAGKVIYKISYFYDVDLTESQGKLLDFIKSWSGVELPSRVTAESKFDDKEKLLRFRYIDNNGNVLVTGTLIPNEKNTYLDAYNYTIYIYTPDNILRTYYTNEKNSSGKRNIIKHGISHDKFNNIVETYKYENGSKNAVTKEKFTYTYDKYNNWIKKVNIDYTTPGKTALYITEREIKYY
jgi:hypothetical protein